eukprot:TRINITY_DN76946_c0_g1_i1.p1 TRINITY_DN76946_c0_g1~~TRINITY_DN76946_c0_g1_i1.p1  ORF type:complete len:789 (-),score=199.82 TRINITY_DN76946_c0_g1_i1:49-2415(-)
MAAHHLQFTPGPAMRSPSVMSPDRRNMERFGGQGAQGQPHPPWAASSPMQNPAVTPATSQQRAPSLSVAVCTKCGVRGPADSNFCRQCGQRRDQEPPKCTPSLRPQSPPPSQKAHQVFAAMGNLAPEPLVGRQNDRMRAVGSSPLPQRNHSASSATSLQLPSSQAHALGQPAAGYFAGKAASTQALQGAPFDEAMTARSGTQPVWGAQVPGQRIEWQTGSHTPVLQAANGNLSHRGAPPGERRQPSVGGGYAASMASTSPGPSARERRESKQKPVHIDVVDQASKTPTEVPPKDVSQSEVVREASLPSDRQVIQYPEVGAEEKIGDLRNLMSKGLEETKTEWNEKLMARIDSIDHRIDNRIEEVVSQKMEQARASDQSARIKKLEEDNEILRQEKEHLQLSVEKVSADRDEQRLQRSEDEKELHQKALKIGELSSKNNELSSKNNELSSKLQKAEAATTSAKKNQVRNEYLQKEVDKLNTQLSNERSKWERDMLHAEQKAEQKSQKLQQNLDEVSHRCRQYESRDCRQKELLLAEREKHLTEREKHLKSCEQELQAKTLQVEAQERELENHRKTFERQAAEFQQRKANLEHSIQEREGEVRKKEQQFRGWEEQRKEVEQQNEKEWQDLQALQREIHEKHREDDTKRDALQKENRALRQNLQEQRQDFEQQIWRLENQMQQQENKAIMTPADFIKAAKRAEGETAGKHNMELMQDVSNLKDDVRWLCWYNEILRRNVPTELECVVEKDMQETMNPAHEGWQIPKDQAPWLLRDTYAASRPGGCGSLGGS